ncbi:2-(3-amino-3-carboxypropyl)histidine synthase subunit 1 [Tetranychus urticae]|uniref:2-(3-amino-3-carboxypropyl)histidine synthase subunit 1 n=1 Tax=Tetranychus urticae TaxID=32264 RepID=T1JYL2_TETUR|nr:2-(3-amino-3-carboxypropyl)histidine synthase subunit 1 [Tetranychus urticae]
MDHECIVVAAKPVEERKTISRKTEQHSSSSVPYDILNDPSLNYQIKVSLPSNYNFDIPRIIWKMRETGSNRVALQFPEGLFIFSTAIATIIEQFTDATAFIIGDVTYGACCVEDYLASLANCTLLVHFGHSCLIPFNNIVSGVKVLYIVVEIQFDYWNFIETVKLNFEDKKHENIAVFGTIQFIDSVNKAVQELNTEGYNMVVPQIRPLSRGEILGCTAPILDRNTSIVLFVADGRFHMEAVMIANPWVATYYKYNPYDKCITIESYDYPEMITQRRRSIAQAVKVLEKGGVFGFILGTLGRQGSPKVLENMVNRFKKEAPNCQHVTLLIPEIKPPLLKELGDSVDIWVQTSCPRLSIDWGDEFKDHPLLNPYEFNLTMDSFMNSKPSETILSSQEKNGYPMDFYASASLGNWTPIHRCNKTCDCK